MQLTEPISRPLSIMLVDSKTLIFPQRKSDIVFFIKSGPKPEYNKPTSFEGKKDLKIATCGINPTRAEYYLGKRGFLISRFVDPSESDYLIMTNRVTTLNEEGIDSEKMTNCFDKYKGNDISKVSRNGLVLSVIRKVE